MSITAAALRELHRIHQQLGDLRDRLERGPKQVRLREASVTQLEAKLAEARDRVKQTQMAADRKQLDLKTSEQKIVDLKTKLNACSTNKEYQALLEQIAAAEMAGSVLADEILEALEKIDVCAIAVKEAEKQLAAGKQELEKASRAVKDSASSITADIQRLEVELATAEKSLPAEVKGDYQRVVRSKGADSLAIADDGTCTGCGQSITLNMQNELRLAKLVFCKSCGRILYLPGDEVPRTEEPLKEYSPYMQQVHEFHAYVENSPRTVKQVVERFREVKWIPEHIGYRVNMGAWSIAGASPNGGGFGGTKGESYKSQLNRELGAEIVANCAESTIVVRERFKLKDGVELSSLVPPEA